MLQERTAKKYQLRTDKVMADMIMASNYPCDIDEQQLIIKVGNKIVSAMDKDHPFTLTFKQVQKIFNSQTACAYSGELFGSIGDITFERINPLLGYVPGNVVLVKRHINQLKGDTIDRFIHQSSMSKDALADMLTTIAKSLRKQHNEEQEARAASQVGKLEQRIQAEVAAAKNDEQQQEQEKPKCNPELATKGAQTLMNIFNNAKQHREFQQQAAKIIGDN